MRFNKPTPTYVDVAGIPGASLVIKHGWVTEVLGNGHQYTWLKPSVTYRFSHEDCYVEWEPEAGTTLVFCHIDNDRKLGELSLAGHAQCDLVGRLRRGFYQWVFMQLKIHLDRQFDLGLLRSKLVKCGPHFISGHPCGDFDGVMTSEESAALAAYARARANRPE